VETASRDASRVASTSYAVELAGGLRLSVDRSGEGHDRFAIGDAVMLLLDPARSLAIAP